MQAHGPIKLQGVLVYLYCQKRERFFNVKTLRQIVKFHEPYTDPADPYSGTFIWDMWALMNIFNKLMASAPNLKPMPRRLVRMKAKAKKARKAREKAKCGKTKRSA